MDNPVPPKLLFKEKQAKILMLLGTEGKEWHLGDLAKESGSTYVHTSRFIVACESAGLVTAEQGGRMKRLVLTDKGKQIAVGLNQILGIANAKPASLQAVTATPKEVVKQA